jgi:AraC-like DNA-binding protein
LKAMEIDKLYLVPDLTLSMLANQLTISAKSISQMLNHELNKNFHDFINEYRVEEVKKRLVDPDYRHFTILAIALDSGFNSKSSFNRVFMKITGMSPKEFKEKNGEIVIQSETDQKVIQ